MEIVFTISSYTSSFAMVCDWFSLHLKEQAEREPEEKLCIIVSMQKGRESLQISYVVMNIINPF